MPPKVNDQQDRINDDFYNGPYKSYKTSETPVSQILNDTFERLHYGLSLNNHDKLFNL